MTKCLELQLSRGFSIIEVVVALTLFGVGILSVLPLYTQSVKFSRNNEDRLIGSMLAQEGLELARNVRDNKWLEAGTSNFVDSFANNFIDGAKYFVCKQNTGACSDVSATDLDNAFTQNIFIIYKKADGKSYTSDSIGNTDSGFKRVVEITPTTSGANTYYTVNSIVRWSVNGVSHDYVASTELYDWR